MNDLLKELEAVVALQVARILAMGVNIPPARRAAESAALRFVVTRHTEIAAMHEKLADYENASKHAADDCVAKDAEIARLRGELAEAVKLARGEREETWEIWQDDMCVAGSDSMSDAEHYLMMYGQDGPVRLVRVVSYRETITQEQIDAMHNSAREVGE